MGKANLEKRAEENLITKGKKIALGLIITAAFLLGSVNKTDACGGSYKNYSSRSYYRPYSSRSYYHPYRNYRSFETRSFGGCW